MTGLPEILRRAGWRSFLWIHDSDQTFFGEDRFFLPRGFRMIDGRDFDPGEPRTNWGFSDLTLARRAAVALDRMEEPFAAMVLTISNHHPFQLPSDAKTRLDVPAAEETGSFRLPGWRSLVGRQTVPMLRTVHYTDEVLGDFFDRIRPRPWFSRTVFVVVSDHGLPVAPLGGVSSLHRFVELRHGVPWILYSPLLPAGPAIPGPSSLADVPPTLLGFLGVSLPASGVGCDRLDPAACDPERPVFSWNEEGEMLTIATASRVFHAVIASERVSGGAGGSLGQEMLFAAQADPEGRHDLSLSEPERVREFRKLARTYLEVYPWLVSHGRSGVPDADLPEDDRSRLERRGPRACMRSRSFLRRGSGAWNRRVRGARGTASALPEEPVEGRARLIGRVGGLRPRQVERHSRRVERAGVRLRFRRHGGGNVLEALPVCRAVEKAALHARVKRRAAFSADGIRPDLGVVLFAAGLAAEHLVPVALGAAPPRGPFEPRRPVRRAREASAPRTLALAVAALAVFLLRHGRDCIGEKNSYIRCC
ncbi:MAG: LTA synthase family protein [Acidobacteriota bacterium]